MILNITKINDKCFKILFTIKYLCKSDYYKGLMLLSFKTDDSILYDTFSKYGIWLSKNDRKSVLLLRLFKQAKQNTTSFNIL